MSGFQYHDGLRRDRYCSCGGGRIRRWRRPWRPCGAGAIIVGGLGTGEANNWGLARLGGGILFVDGIIYASSPDNARGINARDGAVLWHYYWKTCGAPACRPAVWACGTTTSTPNRMTPGSA